MKYGDGHETALEKKQQYLWREAAAKEATAAG
jgi:hypothetical protein